MDVELINKIIIVLYQYICTSLYISGNVGNLFCLIIFCQKPWRKNVCVFYFLVLLLLDTIYLNSSVVGYFLTYGFNFNLIRVNGVVCKLFNYVSIFLSILSPTILICASIDRLLISSKNIDTRLYSSRRLAYFSISISSIIWSIFFLHVLIKFDIQQLTPFYSICLFNLMEFYAIFMLHSMLLINIVVFVVMIILSVLSFKNVHRIRSIPRRQRQIGRTMHKKDFQLLRCLFAKDIIYIFCNIFLCFYVIFNTITSSRVRTLWEQQLNALLFHVSSLIHHISSCASFFTYVLISRAFRQDFQRLVWKMVGKDIPAIRDDEPNEQVIGRVTQEMVIVHTITA